MVLKDGGKDNQKLNNSGLIYNIMQANWVKKFYYAFKSNFKGLMKLLFIRRLISRFMAMAYKSKTPMGEKAVLPAAVSEKMGYTPWERRKKLLATIQELLKESDFKTSLKLKVYWFASVDFECAVLGDQKKAFFHLLEIMTERLPELEVLLFKGDNLTVKNSTNKLNLTDIYEADCCKVGIPVYWDLPRSGYVTILFVTPEKRGYLAYHLNARKADWSREFNQEVKETFSYDTEEKCCREVVAEVDLVYTWVESNDPAWQQNRERYVSAESSNLESAINDERYINRDELKYSLRSVHLYAPFIRHIYIVTADQVPRWLNTDSNKVRLVSHRDIFPEAQMLPTFNSHSIEACLHRIENLSEHFIYFNDDFFLGSEVSKSDFFTVAGLLKIYLSRSQRILIDQPTDDGIPTDWAAYNANVLLKRDFGFSFDRKLKHYPYALRKSVLREIEQRYSQEIRQTRYARFRSNHDLALPSMFFAYYSIATGCGVEWPDQAGEYVYADTGDYNFYKTLPAIANNRPRFFCLNLTRQRDIQPEQQAQLLKTFLDRFYPKPSPYEKESNG